MPNGRTDGFGVTRNEFERLLKGVSSDTAIGMRVHPDIGSVSASELNEMLKTHPEDLIGIEEQDFGSFYILHFELHFNKNEDHFERFVIVSRGTPLYEDLRQLHFQYLKRGD